MVKGVWGGYFRALRAVARLIRPPRQLPDQRGLPAARVFVCRHKNMSGPLRTMLWMDGPLRPWVLDAFFRRADCYRQFRRYTLTVRMGWPVPVAAPVAGLISLLLPPLVRSMGAIAVHRDGRASLTLRETVRALRRGEAVIVYPDTAYADASNTVGTIHTGFLLIDRLYRRTAGGAVAFVPLAARDRDIVRGKAIYAGEGETPDALGERVRAALRALE